MLWKGIELSDEEQTCCSGAKAIKISLRLSQIKKSVSLVQITTFQTLSSYMWLVAAVLDSADIEHFDQPHKVLLSRATL